MNIETPNLLICIGLMLFGLIGHFILKLGELENQGTIITPWQYWRQHPYTSLSVIFMAFSFIGLQAFSNQLSYSAALLTGIAANSLGDKIRARVQAMT